MAEAVGEPEPGADDGSGGGPAADGGSASGPDGGSGAVGGSGDGSGGGSDAAASGTAAATAAPAGRAGTAVRRADWRGRRPFWGGLLVLLGGSEVLFTEKAPLPIVLHIGMQGLAGYLVPAVMVICGLLILFNPAQRLFYSILAVLASLGTWVTSNLGGFLLGMLLGVVGASLTFGWVPDQPLRRGRQRRWDRREQRRAAKAAGV